MGVPNTDDFIAARAALEAELAKKPTVDHNGRPLKGAREQWTTGPDGWPVKVTAKGGEAGAVDVTDPALGAGD